MAEIPSSYDHLESERRWQQRWDDWQLHRWDPTQPRERTFVVDTPPPTVSGSLHVGHVFSYTHQDLLVRYQRMRGRNIAYPMGWDDNGLPTERRVQNLLGIRCNPHLPYEPDWQPRMVAESGSKDIREVSRRNFIEACATVTAEDEKAFEQLWRRLGLSLDWSEQYATIDEHCRRISQLSFLDLVAKNLVYNVESPTMWDVDFKTAVAQAEVEDRSQKGLFFDIRFAVEGGGELQIATTRPELLAACIAVVAHPDDERYRPLFGRFAITPLYGVQVPILAAEHADPDKGTGILMVCTFGDAMDVEWWKRSGLPVRQVIGRDGRMIPVEFDRAPFASVDPESAQRAWDEIVGLGARQAKKRVVEQLATAGAFPGGGAALVGEPRPTDQMVKFYEKGERPLEFVPTRQWFVRILEHRDELLAQGDKIQWHPSHMKTRYVHWVEGLNQDWCISRQRYFGVPFPVWYPVLASGEPDFERPIFGSAEMLPVDPLTDAAPGHDESRRDQPGGFTGDPDVMDTWATSSLTPQIQSHWGVDHERHRRLFPMDVRPQSHEIIRTWAFYTIVKAWMHEREVPWRHVVISGWILDPDRKKMSKSKGNVVTPESLLDEWSSDAVRYWAARARLGTDTAFDPGVFKVGKRLTTKVFNASRFVLMQLERGAAGGAAPGVEQIVDPLDIALVERLREVVEQATRAFDAFDYAAALQTAEEAFWGFCDSYLELVKLRAYGDEDTLARRSAVATLQWALRTFLRLLAPFLPYVTEEVWSWRFAGDVGQKSVHTAPWPSSDEVAVVPRPTHHITFDTAVEVLSAIRGTKTKAQKSLRWPVQRLVVQGPEPHRQALAPVLEDVLRAGNVADGAATVVEGAALQGQRFTITVELAESAD